jgi:predicted regulator of Ras-like GTPase activity (Roadblock/LC7/MglB family)
MASGLNLSSGLIDEMDRILAELRQKTRVSCVILADVSGQLVSATGATTGFDAQTVAALTAGDMSATAELARQLGEARPFRILFHEGEQRHLYLSDVGNSLILIVVFDTKVPIGLVRVFTERASRALLPLTDRYEMALDHARDVLSEAFDESLSDELDGAFGAF